MRNLTTSDILGGLFIGGVLLLILTKKDESQQLNDLRQSNLGVNNLKSLDVQDFDEFNLKLTQSVVQTVEQVSDSPVIEQVSDSPVIEQVSDSQIVEQTSNLATEYGNRETWKILRNVDGDIETIEVQRSAKLDVRQ